MTNLIDLLALLLQESEGPEVAADNLGDALVTAMTTIGLTSAEAIATFEAIEVEMRNGANHLRG